MCGPTEAPASSLPPVPSRQNHLLPSCSLNMQLFSVPVCFSLPQPKWADLTPAGRSGARLRGVRCEPCGDPAPPRAKGAKPPHRVLGLFLREMGVGNKNSKCGEDVHFAAVGVGVWTQTHTCYQAGLYTRFTSPRTPRPRSSSAQRCVRRAERRGKRSAMGKGESRGRDRG